MGNDSALVTVVLADEIVVAGELDAHTSPLLAEVARSVPPGSRGIDATDVTFVDASGLNLLLALHREAAGAGSTLSIRASAPVRRLVELTRLDDVLLLV